MSNEEDFLKFDSPIRVGETHTLEDFMTSLFARFARRNFAR